MPPRPTERVETPTELLRITVETPEGDLDLSVPDDLTPAALIGIVLSAGPASLRDRSVGRGGWLIGKRSGGVLPGGSSLAELGIAEAGVLRLVGAADEAPEPTFDDVADAVADASGSQPHRWDQTAGRWLSASVAGSLGVIAAGVALLSGPKWTVTWISAAAAAVVLLAAAGLVSRGLAQRAAASSLGVVAAAAAAVAASTALAGDRSVVQFAAPELAAGLGAAVLAAALGTALVGRGAVAVMATLVASVGGAIVAVVCCIWTIPRVGAGALCVLVTLLLTPIIPALAFRLARFELPPIPTSAEDLKAINVDVDAPDVSSRTLGAVSYVTALVIGGSVVGIVGLVLLAAGRQNNTTATALIFSASVAVLLRARLFTAIAQRLPFLLTGAAGITIGALRVGYSIGGHRGIVWMVLGLLLAMIVATGFAARTGPPKSPFYGRAAELLEILLAVALVPLIASVMGLVGLVRGLGG